MTIIDEGRQLQIEAAKLRCDRRRRYPPELRRRILDWVGRAMAVGFTEADCGNAVGVKTWRFRCWRQAPELTEVREETRTLSLVPIGIADTVPAAVLSLVAPSGYRIEGLSLEQAVTLLRELA